MAIRLRTIQKTSRARRNRRQNAISAADLALKLELDLLLGRRDDFHRRLQRALKDALTQRKH